MELRRFDAARFAVRVNRVQHNAEHADTNRNADPENQHVQSIDFGTEFGNHDAGVRDTGRHINLVLGIGSKRRKRRRG